MDGKAFGFSPSQDISLLNADITGDPMSGGIGSGGTCGGDNHDQRLSWHLTGDAGWRVGCCKIMSLLPKFSLFF
jgi:hypothetical protein